MDQKPELTSDLISRDFDSKTNLAKKHRSWIKIYIIRGSRYFDPLGYFEAVSLRVALFGTGVRLVKNDKRVLIHLEKLTKT